MSQLSRFFFLLLSCIALVGPYTAQAQRSPYAIQRHFKTKIAPGAVALSQNEIECLMAEACRAENCEDYSQALSVYERVYDLAPCSCEAAEALYQSAKIYDYRNQFRSSFELYNKLAQNHPNYPRFNQVIASQFQIATRLMEGERHHYFGLVPGFRSYEESVKCFEDIVKNAPSSHYAPLSLLNIGLLARANDKPEEAVDALDRLINEYPTSNLIPSTLVELGDTYASLVRGPGYDQGATLDAAQNYETFLILFPNHPEVPCVKEKFLSMIDTYAQSKLMMGDFYYRFRNNCTAALIFDKEVLTIAPESDAAELSKDQIDRIEAGIPPPLTPVDRIFGRYKKAQFRSEETQVGIESLNIDPIWDEESPDDDPCYDKPDTSSCETCVTEDQEDIGSNQNSTQSSRSDISEGTTPKSTL